MNSKEKAEELTLRYYKLGLHLYMPISFAKQCSLIAINEIILLLNHNQIETEYWQEVKNEIKKL